MLLSYLALMLVKIGALFAYVLLTRKTVKCAILSGSTRVKLLAEELGKREKILVIPGMITAVGVECHNYAFRRIVSHKASSSLPVVSG